MLGAGAIASGLALVHAIRADRALGDPLDSVTIAAWLSQGAAASLLLGAGLFAPLVPRTALLPALAGHAVAAGVGACNIALHHRPCSGFRMSDPYRDLPAPGTPDLIDRRIQPRDRATGLRGRFAGW